MAIIKGTKCDCCQERIEYVGITFRICGLDYYFCDKNCLDDWMEEIAEYEDVIKPEEYDI
jgi:putative lipase involved disintegration of autophagic bodies